MSEETIELNREDFVGEDDNIFEGYGIEVILERNSDFMRIREVLTRMGEVNGKDLYQNCYILHKRGRYIIAHYHELMCLDGSKVEVLKKDLAIRNKIADLLESWELITFVDPDENIEPMAAAGDFKVIPFKDKPNWNLISPYAIGVDKRANRPHRDPPQERS